jgi:NhaA family Na+:H+ antiporter
VVGPAILGGTGFTVSLLVGELAFDPGSPADAHVKVAVLAGSLVAALGPAVLPTETVTASRTPIRIEQRELSCAGGP